MRGGTMLGRVSSIVLAVALVTVSSAVGLASVAGADTLAISGEIQIPSTLTVAVSSGSGSYTYQWYDCSSSVAAQTSTTPPSTCSTISGATSSSYTLSSSDYLQYVTVGVTDSSTTYYAASVGPILEPAPAPMLTSSFASSAATTDVGTTASAPAVSTGFTVYNSTGVSYQWYDCSSSVTAPTTTQPSTCSTMISGATNSTYVLAPADVGYYLVVRETVTNAVGSASAFTSSTTSAVSGGALVPVTSSSSDWPTLSSLTPASLSVALTSPGTWTGSPAATSYSVQWYRCSFAVGAASTVTPSDCIPVALSPSSLSGPWSYTFVSADVGSYLLAGVTAYNGFTSSAVYYSPSTTAVVAVAPRPTSLPAVSGSAVVGGQLGVSAGTWSGLPAPTVVGYAWYACSSNPSWSGAGQVSTPPALPSGCGLIGGATSSTLSLTSAQSGEWVVAQVQASNSAGNYYYLPPATQVAAATASTAGAVAIATPNVNGVYSASLTTPFNGAPAPTVVYAWYDCANAVSATSTPTTTFPLSCGSAVGSGSSYAPTSSDLGKDLVVVATATSPGVATTYVNSASILLTGAAASFSGVTISGASTTTALGTTMTASPAFTAVPAPTSGQVTYQWYSCTGSQSAGATLPASGCAAIGGATAASYTPDTLASATNYTGSGTNNVFVQVTINNGQGAISYHSATTQLTTAVPSIAVSPSLTTSTASTTTPLTARNGTWLGAPTPTLTDTWYYCTSPVSSPSTALASWCHSLGATGSSYQPTGSFVGDYFLVGVTGHNGVGGGTTSDLTVYSASTTAPLVSTLAITSLSITGTATVGSVLSSTAVVSASTSYTTTYQWYECAASEPVGVAVPANCYAIAGAVSSTFVPTVQQSGYYLTVLETVTGNGTTASALAATTGLVTSNAPGAPTSVTAVAGLGQATVSWAVPTTGLAPTSYRVVASNGATCTTSTTSCVVTGLLYGTYYSFTVTASNAYGAGPVSVVSNAIMPSESTPAAPSDVRAVARNQSASISWIAAVNNGSLVTLYVVGATPGGLSCTTTTTSCVVRGLTNGVTYTLRVTARNAVGTGPASLPVVVTPKVAAPSAPVSISVRRGSGQLLVSWVAGPTNGAVVNGYRVTVTAAGVTHTCTTTTTSCLVRGLTNGVAYHVVVTTLSRTGSAASAVRGLIAPAGRPSAPFIFHSARGRGVVIVYFRAPTVLNGAPVAYYQYLINGRWTVQPIKGRTVIVLRGLRLATAYVVRVRAVSVGGASAASRPVRVITL